MADEPNAVDFLNDFIGKVDPQTFLNEVQLFQPPMFVARQALLTRLYRQIRNVPGDILEFGCRFGKNIALFAALRRMHELFDNRHIIGFDTFEGLPQPAQQDGEDERVALGNYTVPEGHRDWLYGYLNGVLKYRNVGLFVGDVEETWPEYITDHRPDCMVALAYFDLDLYAGTRAIIESVWERMPKGSILVMDELGCHHFPGETLAVEETVGLGLRWQQDLTCNFMAWTVKE